ncbi:MAG: hypothetical protein O3A53_19750 [Acidobacteria bacterium]|nr:hypothetical protein [Acidobacteriota bacterium]
MTDAVEQKEGRFEAVAIAPGASSGPQGGLKGYGERGVEVGAAGGKEIAAGFGEGLLEHGKFAPVPDDDSGDSGGSAGRITGQDGDRGVALGAREAVERTCVGHGCVEKRKGPLEERALLDSG